MNTPVIICNGPNDIRNIKCSDKFVHMSKESFEFLMSHLYLGKNNVDRSGTVVINCTCEVLLKIIKIVCENMKFTLIKGEYDDLVVIMELFGLESYVDNVDCFPKVGGSYKFDNNQYVLMLKDDMCVVSYAAKQVAYKTTYSENKKSVILKLVEDISGWGDITCTWDNEIPMFHVGTSSFKGELLRTLKWE